MFNFCIMHKLTAPPHAEELTGFAHQQIPAPHAQVGARFDGGF
jgi:hypothetical protein